MSIRVRQFSSKSLLAVLKRCHIGCMHLTVPESIAQTWLVFWPYLHLFHQYPSGCIFSNIWHSNILCAATAALSAPACCGHTQYRATLICNPGSSCKQSMNSLGFMALIQLEGLQICSIQPDSKQCLPVPVGWRYQWCIGCMNDFRCNDRNLGGKGYCRVPAGWT